MITELRVYHTRERLIEDFESMAEGASRHEGFKIIPHSEIIVANVLRIIFKIDVGEKVRGYRPDKVFIDEMVDSEVRDYFESRPSPIKEEHE